MRRVLLATLVAVASVGASAVVGQSTSDALHAWPVRENVFMLVGPGANTTVHIGRDGVLVVDPQMSDGLSAAGSDQAPVGQADPVHRGHDD
jgi:hypothetical protein